MKEAFIMNVLIVYCHPSKTSFTAKLKDAFISGLEKGGHEYEISDLYDMNFDPSMSESEYLFDRMGEYKNERLAGDIAKEQVKISGSDAVAFIFPVFWSASPAKLVGWFQRVMTKDFAYGQNPQMPALDKASCLVSLAESVETEQGRSHIEAIKASMLGSKIFTNAETSEINVFDKLSSDILPEDERKKLMEDYLKQAFELGENF